MRLPYRLQGQKVKSQGGAGAYCNGDLAAQLVIIVMTLQIKCCRNHFAQSWKVVQICSRNSVKRPSDWNSNVVMNCNTRHVSLQRLLEEDSSWSSRSVVSVYHLQRFWPMSARCPTPSTNHASMPALLVTGHTVAQNSPFLFLRWPWPLPVVIAPTHIWMTRLWACLGGWLTKMVYPVNGDPCLY